LWEIRADGTGLRRIFPASTHQTHDATGAWNNNQRYFLFVTGADSRLDEVLDSASNVWAMRESWSLMAGRRQPVQLTEGPISFRSLANAGDSDRFFALGSHPEFQLMRIDPRSSHTNVVLPDAGASDVDVTPDGEWLVYSLRESGALWKSRRNGKERIELTPASPGALAPQWSPDEKEILFTAFFLDKRPRLYVVPSEGGTPRALVPDNAGSSRSGDWSSDGKRILFDYAEGDRSEVRILQRETGMQETLPNSEDLTQPRWSPDGKRIAAINSRTGDILVYTLDTRKWSIAAEATSAQGMRWSADSNFVYFQETADPEQSVFRVRLGRALPEKVFGFGEFLGSMASQCRFTGVAPDGSIYATVDRGGTDIYALDVRFP
jgi:dipeptidyl aminopeptidase/acylaminoacyl peptidase